MSEWDEEDRKKYLEKVRKDPKKWIESLENAHYLKAPIRDGSTDGPTVSKRRPILARGNLKVRVAGGIKLVPFELLGWRKGTIDHWGANDLSKAALLLQPEGSSDTIEVSVDDILDAIRETQKADAKAPTPVPKEAVTGG